VLLEGSSLSREHRLSAALAEAHEVHVLRLTTPLDRCVRNVVTRQRARRDARPRIARVTTALDAEVGEACERLRRSRAGVEVLRFDDALRRVRHLLGLGGAVPGRRELPDRRAGNAPTAATDVS